MDWIEHLEAAASIFTEESELHKKNNDPDLAKAAMKDANAIIKLIEDISNGKTQEVNFE